MTPAIVGKHILISDEEGLLKLKIKLPSRETPARLFRASTFVGLVAIIVCALGMRSSGIPPET